ncbi:TonB-dependent receptor [Microbulbifer agarilyticus]|uniref:TonB-dependent receptor plug domain-containing protein n=1 Tax=Microbulbifer agarilyticus TaxID=260552 RepID=UPI001C97C9C7|nr:TonB-dependent receptor [Microbulbifer agarilyticus]MBY6210623.1 TonB-dependent receptor [Microbulbifer agarilyticus]
MNKILLSSAILAASSAPALAQSSDEKETTSIPNLETVIVVSSRQATPLRHVATSVTTIDEEQIKARGYSSLSEILRSVSSVSVSNTGGMGKTTSLQVRGESGFRTLVRIDGIDISDPTSTQGGAHVEHILSSNLARVELLRGPQGMLYGADAGGVLDISTRKDNGAVEFNAGAEAGSYDSHRYNLSSGGAIGRADFYVSAAKAYTNGFNTSTGDVVLKDDDGYNNGTVHSRFGFNFSEQWRVEAVVRDTDATSEYDRCGWSPQVDDCSSEYEQKNQRINLAHNSENTQHEFAYTHSDLSRAYLTEGVTSYQVEGAREQLNLNGSANITGNHGVVYGLERREDTSLDLSRDQWAAYSEYQGSISDQAFVTLGLRHDDNSDFGSHNSYRASAAYVFDEIGDGSLKLKASYGTGFRAPSLSEINYNRNYYPDLPALAPEESRGLDVGAEYYYQDALHLEFVVFDQIVEDEIWFNLADYSYRQGGRGESRGVELIGAVTLSEALSLSANYTYTDSETTDDIARPRRPRHMANLGVTYRPMAALSLVLNTRTSIDAIDIDGSDMDDYQVVDASLRYQLNNTATIYVRAENLLDEEYVEAAGFNTAERAAYAGVELRY